MERQVVLVVVELERTTGGSGTSGQGNDGGQVVRHIVLDQGGSGGGGAGGSRWLVLHLVPQPVLWRCWSDLRLRFGTTY
jgi:hypothetical protein